MRVCSPISLLLFEQKNMFKLEKETYVNLDPVPVVQSFILIQILYIEAETFHPSNFIKLFGIHNFPMQIGQLYFMGLGALTVLY